MGYVGVPCNLCGDLLMMLGEGGWGGVMNLFGV